MLEPTYRSSLSCSDFNTPCSAGSKGFLMNPSPLGLWKDPLDDLQDPDELLLGDLSMEQVAQLVHTAPPGYQVQPPLQLSLSQLLSLGPSALGWQVLVQGEEGTFIGYLCWLLDHCSRLGLEQASQPESGVRRVGVLLLSYCHVSSVTLLARRTNQPRHLPAAAKSGVVEEKRGRSLLMRKLVTPHQADRDQQSDDDEDGEDSSGDSDEIPPLPPPALRISRPSSWTVIDKLDESYREAVSAISEEQQVGLSAVGHNLGRWGTLAWLALATSHTVYLFDAATLGLLPLLLGTTSKGEGAHRLSQHSDGEEDSQKQCNNHQDLTHLDNHGDSHGSQSLNDKKSVSNHGENLVKNRKKHCDTNTTGQELTSICSNGAVVTDSKSHLVGCDPESTLPHSCLDKGCLESPALTQQPVQTSKSELLTKEERPRHCSLRDVLEDPDLEVVVHDSRNFQDFLQHRAGFTISSLFDTQAAEVYLYITLNSGDCPAFVPSLSSLLQRRLHLSPQHLLYERVQRSFAGDSSAYLERPLSERILQGIASSAAFLCELRALQLQDALADLRQLTALHCLAHALKDDLMRSRVEQHVVPAAVQRLGRQTVLNYKDSRTRRRP